MPKGPESLQQAAWAGLQDSMPRAALLSLHARVEGVEPSTWEDPSLIQLWGPRYQVYVVAKPDFPLFSLARLPDNEKGRLRAEQMAERLHAGLRGGRVTDRELGKALRIGNALPRSRRLLGAADHGHDRDPLGRGEGAGGLVCSRSGDQPGRGAA